MSAPSPKRFRVTVIERLSHDAVIEAPDAQAAEAEAGDTFNIHRTLLIDNNSAR
jgi:hypothetical protein